MVFLEILKNSQENTCCKVSFLIKFQAVSIAHDLSCVFSYWKFLGYFIFDRKMKGKKRNTLMRLKYLLFCLSIDLFDIKISKEIWQMVICSEKEFKRNLILQFSWLEDFAEKMFLCGEHFTNSKTKNGLNGQL